MHIHNNLRCEDDNVSATIMPLADCKCGGQHTSIEALNVIRGAISSDLQASVRSRHAHVFI